MEPGKYYKKNIARLSDVEELGWAAAIDKCRAHIKGRIGGRTGAGAHTATRLGMDPFDYYLTYAYDALMWGLWEWKGEYTLSQQMIRIIDSTISTEVEKTKTKKAQTNKLVSVDPADFGVAAEADEGPVHMVQEILFAKRVSVIDEMVKGNEDFDFFWECIKDGMRPVQIAEFMEKTTKQVYKIQERLVKKIKESTYFEDL